MTAKTRLTLIALLVLAWIGRSGAVAPPDPGRQLVAVVYESADHPIPPQAVDARGALEAAGFEFRIVDDDITTGTGQVPAELAASIEAARSVGLPALVIAQDPPGYAKVRLAVGLPGTAEQIIETASR